MVQSWEATEAGLCDAFTYTLILSTFSIMCMHFAVYSSWRIIKILSTWQTGWFRWVKGQGILTNTLMCVFKMMRASRESGKDSINVGGIEHQVSFSFMERGIRHLSVETSLLAAFLSFHLSKCFSSLIPLSLICPFFLIPLSYIPPSSTASFILCVSSWLSKPSSFKFIH